MKTLEKDDIYNNLSQFLDSRGIKLRKGSYAKALQNGCALLTDAINLGQESFEYAKTELDRTLDQMRQTVHEATAPRPAKTQAEPTKPEPEKPTEAKQPVKPRKTAEQKTNTLKRQAATRHKQEAAKARAKSRKKA